MQDSLLFYDKFFWRPPGVIIVRQGESLAGISTASDLITHGRQGDTAKVILYSSAPVVVVVAEISNKEPILAEIDLWDRVCNTVCVIPCV